LVLEDDYARTLAAHPIVPDPILASSDLVTADSPPEKNWDSFVKTKPKPTEDTRGGRAWIRDSLKADTLEGAEIAQWMKAQLYEQRTGAIKDDWAWWIWNGEEAPYGKLLTVFKSSEEVRQLFFDDNIDHTDARIVDCRDEAGNTMPPEVKFYVLYLVLDSASVNKTYVDEIAKPVTQGLIPADPLQEGRSTSPRGKGKGKKGKGKGKKGRDSSTSDTSPARRKKSARGRSPSGAALTLAPTTFLPTRLWWIFCRCCIDIGSDGILAYEIAVGFLQVEGAEPRDEEHQDVAREAAEDALARKGPEEALVFEMKFFKAAVKAVKQAVALPLWHCPAVTNWWSTAIFRLVQRQVRQSDCLMIISWRTRTPAILGGPWQALKFCGEDLIRTRQRVVSLLIPATAPTLSITSSASPVSHWLSGGVSPS